MMGSALLFAWSAVYAATSLVACVRARRFFSRDSTPAGERPPALVVRPCAGDEAHLHENLASTALAARPSDTIVFAIARSDDGAAPTASHVCAALVARGFDARVVVTGAVAANRKADQIARVLARETTQPLVIVADSDVALAEGDFDALLAPLRHPRVAAAWSPPCETGEAATLGDRAARAVLCSSLHAFPLLAGLDPRGMVGKLVAVNRAPLARAGGFEALSAHLGEDMELARRLRALGYAITCVPRIAHARASGRSFGDTALRFTRWLAVIRAQRSLLLASYPLLFCALPFFIAGTLACGSPLAFTALGLAFTARLVVAGVASRIAGFSPSIASIVVDTALAEATLLTALSSVLLTRNVRWRDRTLRLDRNGLLAAPRER